MTENRDVESKLDAYVLKAEFENKVELNTNEDRKD